MNIFRCLFSGLPEEVINLLKEMWISKLANLGSLEIEPESSEIEPEPESCDENEVVLAQSETSKAAERSTGAISKKKLKVTKVLLTLNFSSLKLFDCWKLDFTSTYSRLLKFVNILSKIGKRLD